MLRPEQCMQGAGFEVGCSGASIFMSGKGVESAVAAGRDE